MTELQSTYLRDQFRSLMLEQTRLLDLLIHDLAQTDFEDPDLKEIADTVSIMLQSMGVSVHSILRLTENMDMAIKDCFGIARTVSEMSINVAYIASSDVEIARRARSHALQKQYRNMNRTGSVQGLEIRVRRTEVPLPKDVPGLAEALDIFTDKKGREIRDWSPLSLDERISKVGLMCERAVTCLFASRFSIYRDSSEMLHGTYSGVVHFWRPGLVDCVDREGFETIWAQNHLATIFAAVFFGVIGAIETCASRFALGHFSAPVQDIIVRARQVVDPPS